MKNLQTSEATERRKIVAHGATVGFVVKPESAPEQGERNVWRLIFCRPFRGLGFLFAIQPTVAPWATFCRASGALAALVLFFAAGATAETTNGLSDAEVQGRQLAQQLCDARPMENLTNTGVIKTRFKGGQRTELRFRSQIIATATNWFTIYETQGEGDQTKFKIEHNDNQVLRYELRGDEEIERDATFPFAGSDFWLGDLSLEFFHWPAQKILPNPTPLILGRSYKLLESTNPNPSTNSYSRVLSWVDRESGGLLRAEAYDAKGKLLKIFEPKSFKKVNSQWQVEEIRMRNDQTESSTRLEFDLKK